MIKCELCGNYFTVDEIESCPNCGMELCPSCYENHVSKCLCDEEDSSDEGGSNIPHICPECGANLELDQDMDGSARVYCDHCDFVQELDEEQLKELNVPDLEENLEDDEDYTGADAFTCPDCGRTFAPDDYENGDAGNGFCRECAPNH